MNHQLIIIELPELLDDHQNKQILAEIKSQFLQEPIHVLIDCSQNRFMHSTGLSCVVALLKITRAHDCEFGLCSINSQIRLLLDVSNVNTIVNVYRDRAEFTEYLELQHHICS